MIDFNRRSFWLLVGTSLTARSEACAQNQKPLKVFVLAGQSNMVGARAVVAELPDDLKGEQASALFFQNGKWVPIAPGKTEKAGFGPEIAFAQRVSHELNEPIGIIKYSVGGTNLAVQWSPINSSSLYGELLRLVRKAQRSRKIEIVGMAWMQGESDAKSKNMASAYAKNLQGLIRRARYDMNSPRMAFVAGRVNPPKKAFPFVDLVRAAQEKCGEPNYAYIDCDSLKKGADNLHYTTAGLVKMGNAFAASVMELASQKKVPSR